MDKTKLIEYLKTELKKCKESKEDRILYDDDQLRLYGVEDTLEKILLYVETH